MSKKRDQDALNPVDFPAIGRRYKPVRCLGEGAQGVVHLAEDRFLGSRLVAIKTLRPRVSEEWRTAFRHEFEVLAGLTHPRLSQVHDFGTVRDGRIYFTRDYVAGDDLFAATVGIGTTSLIALFVEICRALKPLHRRGLLHCDLKPGNIICSPDGMAHLIDFSFVRSSGDDAMRRGTVQYMAPEVIEGHAADVRTDLYSLGATMFDIVSGAPPFEGSVSDVVSGHLGTNRPALRPVRVRATSKESERLLAGLEAIIARLLERQSDDRFPDIFEVEAALTALCPDAVPPDPLSDYPVISGSAGQEEELRLIRQAVTRQLEGTSGKSPLWVVEGELGTGKSTLLRGIKWWAQLVDIAVIETRCGGGGLLEPVAELIDQALALSGEDEVDLTASEHLVEQLSRPGAAGTDLNGLTRESARLLVKLARRGRLIVAIDDVEQASAETLQILRGLIAAIDPRDPLVILTASDPSFPWKTKLSRGNSVTMPVLGFEQIAPLVKSFFGRAEERVVERVLAHTGGNPLFVMTLLRDLATSGEGAERLERLGPPRQLEIYWRDNLETLGSDERRLIEAAAVLARPSETHELAGTAQISQARVTNAIAGLESGGWLRRGTAGWHVATGPLAREVLAAMDSEARIACHSRALEIEPDEARQLYHAAMSGDVERVRSRGRDVVLALERLGALHAARELLGAMEGVLHDTEDATKVRLDLGRVCLAEGALAVSENYLTPLTTDRDSGVRGQALLLLGRLHSARGELDAARKCLNQALQVAADPANDARALHELAGVEYKRGDIVACASSAEIGLDRAPSGHPVRADLLGVLAKAASRNGRHEDALIHAQEAAREARETGDRRSLALAVEMLSWVRQNSGDVAGAAQELERAVTLNRQFGDFPRLIRDLRTLGDLKWWLEEWHDTLTHYEEAARLAGAVANPAQQLKARIALGGALTKVGRFERAQLLLSEAEQEAAEFEQEELRLEALNYLAELAGVQGEIGVAIEQFYCEAKAGWEKLGGQAYLADLELDMAGLYLWRAEPGDAASAKPLIESAEKRRREFEGRGFADRLELQRGALAIAEGRFEEGVKCLDRLTERAGESGFKDLAWQAHLAVARGHLARGGDFMARRCLRQAESILDDLTTGFSAEHKTAFWQDVRRNEVRHLLSAIAPSSSLSSSILIEKDQADLDQEAKALYRVLEFNKQLSAEPDLDRLLEAILDAAIELTRAERGLVLMVALERGEQGLEVRAAREIEGGSGNDPYDRFSRSIAESVHLDGDPVVTVDAMGDERFNEFLSIHELKLKSVACLPVRYRGQALGVLYLENRLKRGRFSGRDLRVLAAFADQVAIAISQAKLLEEASRRQAELQDAREALEEAYARQTEDLQAKSTDLKLTREKLERIHKRLEGEGDYHGIVGSCRKMSKVFSLVDRVKDLDVPVVFIGESGTGKDLLARVLHDQGARGSGPFVVLNCGGVPETLIEATLFGHVKGAFSGAGASRDGVLEAASGGTLYLDEIGDMSPRMQVDLLRVLQEGNYTPLGAAEVVEVDLRLVASSKIPLDELVEQGRLRRDLLYRLEVVTVEIPPLRKRKEDILPLARRILERESRQAGYAKRGLSKEAVETIVSHNWPGNVRELEQAIRRALVIGEDTGPITPEELTITNRSSRVSRLKPGARKRSSRGNMDTEEEAQILAALERCQWNRTKAAEEMGIPRRTFYRKLGKLGIVKKRNRSD
ncbi:MAG: protein kinase [Deltaproteobacteria bacterium]|nr:protein kinase [Deltaproteobacteria bacterium]